MEKKKERYKLTAECENVNIPSIYRGNWVTASNTMAKKFKGLTGKIIVSELRTDDTYKESFVIEVNEDGYTSIIYKIEKRDI
jgi:hypothetical protein